MSNKSESTEKKLANIAKKYSGVDFNKSNYNIGGGLDGERFASRRHEDAKSDSGKLTFGEACALFTKATGMDLENVKSIIKYAVPNMEWHHAGKLPKAYGGGMKKTYFINSTEIVMLAENWGEILSKKELSDAAKIDAAQKQRTLEQLRFDFLTANAKKVERVASRPIYFHLTKREMEGKYGWFDSTYKTYNLPEYFSGWEFESKEKYDEFLAI